MNLWLIEGLPGSGKSTMAGQLCAFARKQGHNAEWFLEEAQDHPVHPVTLKESRRDAARFSGACLDAWSRYVEKHQNLDAVHILEGSAFQSTVRFMMEGCSACIDEYYRRFEKIVAPLNPRLIYLRPNDPFLHSIHISDFRGMDWTQKVSGYLEKSSYSKHESLSGEHGMHRFWTNYASLCDRLVSGSGIPAKTIDMVWGDWNRHLTEAADFLTQQ